MKWTHGEFTIFDRRDRVDGPAVHGMLRETYWAKNLSFAGLKETIKRSLCFSVFHGDRQVGYGRVMTDFTTYAVILDTVIHREYRGRGLGRWMVQCISNHPKIARLRQVLWTRDAEVFYSRLGFSIPENQKFMAKGLGNTPEH